MKPNNNFKLAKQTKRCLSLFTFKSKDAKSTYKKLMIEAQMYSLVAPKTIKPEADNS